MNQRSRQRIVNGISASRIVLAIGIVIVGCLQLYWLAVVLAIIGFYSDHLDGKYARKWQVTSPFGAFFDPFTDKVLCLTIIAFLAVVVSPWFWIIFAVFFIYDTTTTTIRLTLRGKLSMPASKIAKAKTASQMVGLLLLLVSLALFNGVFASVVFWIGMTVLVFSAVLTLRSLNQYLHFVAKYFQKNWLELVSGVESIDFTRAHKQQGIKAVCFDIEGTLTEWASREISESTRKEIKRAEKSGIKTIALVTNISSKHTERLQTITKQTGAAKVYSPSKAAESKPSPRMIKQFADEFDIPVENIMFVGDKLVDVTAARRAGVGRMVWVERFGVADHPGDRLFYRPFEKIIKSFFETTIDDD